MALYVYNTANGNLHSYSPSDSDPVASPSDLAANGFTAVSGLPVLDDTHAWDPATKTVITVTPPRSIPTPKQFWQRFTPTEREALENLAQTGSQAAKNKVAAFLRYISSSEIDCNDPYIQSAVQTLETAGVIAPGRAAQILV